MQAGPNPKLAMAHVAEVVMRRDSGGLINGCMVYGSCVCTKSRVYVRRVTRMSIIGARRDGTVSAVHRGPQGRGRAGRCAARGARRRSPCIGRAPSAL